jgi:sugar lactone lactonase YvrE
MRHRFLIPTLGALLLLLLPAALWAQPGDLNGDSRIGINDVVLGLRVLAGLTPSTPQILAGGDLNGDGKVEISEILRILKVVAGLATPDSLGGTTPPGDQPGVYTLVGERTAFADGPLAQARFQLPEDIQPDGKGNLLVADRWNHRIRRISADGMVSTVAGTGVPGYKDGPAAEAQFDNPMGVAAAADGTIYVADTFNERIRKIAPDGTVSTVAGAPSLSADGETWAGAFKDGAGNVALFNDPRHLDLDGQGGLYVADTLNNRIRHIDAQGNVTTFAGDTYGFQDGVPAAQALFRELQDLRMDKNGKLWIADTFNHLVRFIGTDGNVGTLAGHPKLDTNSEPLGGFVDGAEPDVQFDAPFALVPSPDGAVYVADTNNWRIRRVETDGSASTVAGSSFGGSNDGPGTEAWLFYPSGLTMDAQGNLMVADTENYSIRKVATDAAHTVTTFAGRSITGYNDGPGSEARVQYPGQTCIDKAGNIYIADSGNDLIRKLSPDGTVTTIAGSSNGYKDGPAATAQFSLPQGIAVDGQGNLYVSDGNNHRIRKITPGGVVSTIAGGGAPDANGFYQGGFADGQGDQALFLGPNFISLGPDGNLYVADTGNSRVRMVTPDGTVSTVAGGGTQADYKDGNVSVARLAYPWAVYAAADGSVYVADSGNNVVRKVKDGAVTTVAGVYELDANGNIVNSFNDGPVAQAHFNAPADVVIDPTGNLYVADFYNNRIRKVTTGGTVSTVAGTGRNGHRDGALNQALFRHPAGVMFDASGALVVSEYANDRIRKVVLPK